MENKINPASLEWTPGKVPGFKGKDFLQKDKGSVKLVKVEPQATYPEHIHPDKTEYAFVVKGKPDFKIANEFLNGEEGDFFIFPVNTKHAILNNTGDECILLVGAIEA